MGGRVDIQKAYEATAATQQQGGFVDTLIIEMQVLRASGKQRLESLLAAAECNCQWEIDVPPPAAPWRASCSTFCKNSMRTSEPCK